jgi:predicted transcriptional regulator
MSQRDRYDIVKDILEIVYDTELLYRNQMNLTWIGYNANLTHSLTVKYVRELVDLGLFVLTDFEPFSYYEIKSKGQRCLRLFGKIEDDLLPSVTDR